MNGYLAMNNVSKPIYIWGGVKVLFGEGRRKGTERRGRRKGRGCKGKLDECQRSNDNNGSKMKIKYTWGGEKPRFGNREEGELEKDAWEAG